MYAHFLEILYFIPLHLVAVSFHLLFGVFILTLVESELFGKTCKEPVFVFLLIRGLNIEPTFNAPKRKMNCLFHWDLSRISLLSTMRENKQISIWRGNAAHWNSIFNVSNMVWTFELQIGIFGQPNLVYSNFVWSIQANTILRASVECIQIYCQSKLALGWTEIWCDMT